VTVVQAGIQVTSPCGIAGAWASNSLFVLLGCDPNTTNVTLKKFTLPSNSATALSQTGDVVSGFALSITNRQPDGMYVAYFTMAGALKSVTLSGTPTVRQIEANGVTDTFCPPLGSLQGTSLFYDKSNALLKANVTMAQAGATLVGSNAVGFAASSISGSAFSNDGNRAIYFTNANGMCNFGSLAGIDTTVANPTPVVLNSDNNGYPGDDAYSVNGTYIFWYDNVQANTNGIGTIHAKQYNDVSGQGMVIGPNGYFVRQTRDDLTAAVMANTVQLTDVMMTHVGDLMKVNVSTGQSTRIVDQMTYLDMLYPSSSMTQVVYTRTDGVFLADFQ
jgi:hypothetical protein